jgi:DNA-binding beta-propeller fold protein YncE
VALGTFDADPCGVSYGGGRVYIADAFTVRKLNPGTDWLTTLAGTGSGGPVVNGGRAASAYLSACATAVDHSGNLVLADWSNRIVRVVAAKTGMFYGRPMTAGDIYTIAGDGTEGFSGDGGTAASAELNQPEGVAVDGAGKLVIADTHNQRVRVVAG